MCCELLGWWWCLIAGGTLGRVERAVTCCGGLRHLIYICKHSRQFLVLHIHLRQGEY
jgi:hypothetical protein